VEAVASTTDANSASEENVANSEREAESHRRRPSDKRSEGRRRRERRAAEPTDSQEAVAVTDAPASEEETGAKAEITQPVEVASSEALSAVFEAPPSENNPEVEAPETAVTPTPGDEPATPAPIGELEPPPAIVAAPDGVDAERTSAEVIGDVIGALVRDTSGVTDAGRAVNDPRITPKPITETETVTEQADLFSKPEAPPVSVIQQDIPRASNDPRGPRAA